MNLTISPLLNYLQFRELKKLYFLYKRKERTQWEINNDRYSYSPRTLNMTKDTNNTGPKNTRSKATNFNTKRSLNESNNLNTKSKKDRCLNAKPAKKKPENPKNNKDQA